MLITTSLVVKRCERGSTTAFSLRTVTKYTRMSNNDKYVAVPTTVVEGMPVVKESTRGATPRELLVVLWAVVMIALSYHGGSLHQFLKHKRGHHRTDTDGVCESARFCSAYAPRSLCLCDRWRDSVAPNSTCYPAVPRPDEAHVSWEEAVKYLGSAPCSVSTATDACGAS